VTAEFQYDVLLSHSSKDKTVVRVVAERLRADGLRVWFGEWEIRAGDSIPAKIEEGLEHSRVLMLCMSANAFGSDWAQLEAGTFRFRDPLNKERRFIPLRLDDAHIKGSLAQFLYINWLPAEREQEYAKLLEACRNPETWPPPPVTIPMKRQSSSLELLKRVKSDGELLLAQQTVTFFKHQVWQESALSTVENAFPNDHRKRTFFLDPPKRRRTTVYHEARKSNEQRDTERAEALREQIDILTSFITQIETRMTGGDLC